VTPAPAGQRSLQLRSGPTTHPMLPLLLRSFPRLGGSSIVGRKDAVIDRARFADQTGPLELGLRDKSNHVTHACSWLECSGKEMRSACQIAP
jgi:hypothetical protein